MTSHALCSMGFARLTSIGELRVHADWSRLPREAGVYAVIWPQGRLPVFLRENMGHAAATEQAITLLGAWVAESDILYIGCTSRPLKKRIRELIRHGLGKAVNHRGGEWVWQVEGIENASLWGLVSDDPFRLKAKLLGQFREKHGRLPFANRAEPPAS